MKSKSVTTYSSAQIDAGQFGAVFHPVTGEKLADLQYDAGRSQFFTHDHSPKTGVAWGGVTTAFPQKKSYRPRIGDGRGRGRATGELFHEHWCFDPFNGKPLKASDGRKLWEQD